MDSSKSIMGWVVGIGAVIIAGIAYFLFGANAPAENVPAENTTNDIGTDTANATGSTDTSASPYKDGTYTAQGAYRTPETTETLTVTLTLKDGVVTDSNITGTKNAPETVRFQGMFISNYKALVIGKNIDSLNITHVSGSSLTPIGFNDALVKIKAEAKA